MRTITIANRKGGCGKTTTAQAFAILLSQKGFRTLLIDADEQRNTSFAFDAKTAKQGCLNLYDLLDRDRFHHSTKDAIQHTEYTDIIASDPQLKVVTAVLQRGGTPALFNLKLALEEVKDDYDFVIIDTGPEMDLILKVCLVASDDVIVPIDTDIYSLQGFFGFYTALLLLNDAVHTNTEVGGILVTMYDTRTKASQDILEKVSEVAERLHIPLFKTQVRSTTKVKTAHNVKSNLITSYPRSTAAEDYRKIVDEYLEMLPSRLQAQEESSKEKEMDKKDEQEYLKACQEPVEQEPVKVVEEQEQEETQMEVQE